MPLARNVSRPRGRITRAEDDLLAASQTTVSPISKLKGIISNVGWQESCNET